MESTLNFRAANESDLDQVYTLVNRCFRGESAKSGWTHEAELLDGDRIDVAGLRELIEAPGSRIELVFSNSALVGCVHLKYSDRQAYVGMVSVDPTQQANGLGKLILSHCEQLAVDWGCQRIGMTVINVRSELIAYYERRGYALTGGSEPFPWGLSQPRSSNGKMVAPEQSDLCLLQMQKSLTKETPAQARK